MKEIITQFTGQLLEPQSPEDLEILQGEYKRNQLVRIKSYAIGPQKQRSVEQLNLLMACCGLVGKNTKEVRFNTKEQVKFACKVHTHFVDPNVVFVRPDGTVQFKYRSFSFANLKHMEACNLFERCFEYMASLLDISKDELIREAKSRMKRVST